MLLLRIFFIVVIVNNSCLFIALVLMQLLNGNQNATLVVTELNMPIFDFNI